jgi:hypothetical protein
MLESPTALNLIGDYYKSAAFRLSQHQLKDKPQCSFNKSQKKNSIQNVQVGMYQSDIRKKGKEKKNSAFKV